MYYFIWMTDNKYLTKIKKSSKNKNEHFICSTYGSSHMQEITQLIKDFDERITLSDHKLYDVFGLENGEEQIKKKYFHK